MEQLAPTELAPRSRAPRSRPPQRGSGGGGVRAVALTVGAATAGLVLVLRAAGALDGWLAVGLAVALLLVVPSAGAASRRFLLNATIAVGGAPLLWLVPLPVGSVGHTGLVLAVASGALVCAALWVGTAGLPARVRAAVPAWRLVDGVPVVAALGAAWVTGSWLRVRDGGTALSALLPGWDHSAHYAMTAIIRSHGTTVDRLPDDGTAWKFADYPQGYHSLVAAVMDLAAPERGTVSSEVVLYTQVQGLVLVLVAGLLGAALCALPWLRGRPALALSTVAVVATAFVVGPGGAAWTTGFMNFVLAAALCGCVLVIALTMPKPMLPVPLAALGAGVVGVAHGWVLLLSLALPAAAVVLLPRGRAARRPPRPQWWLSGVLLIATGVGLLRVVEVLRTLNAGDVLVIPGGIVAPEPGQVAALALAAAAAALAAARRSRVVWTAAVPLVGLGCALALAAFQLRTEGGPSYYLWKYLLGVQLVSVLVLAVAGSRLLARLPRIPGPRAAVVSVIVAAAATQAFGYVGAGRGVFVVDPGLGDPAGRLVAAADLVSEQPVGRPATLLLASVPRAPHPVAAQQWLLALTSRWTVPANDAAMTLLPLVESPQEVEAIALSRLRERPDTVVLLPEEDAPTVTADLAPPDAERVIGLRAVAAQAG